MQSKNKSFKTYVELTQNHLTLSQIKKNLKYLINDQVQDFPIKNYKKIKKVQLINISKINSNGYFDYLINIIY